MPGMSRKYVDQDWIAERMAIRIEHIRLPTQKQIHDALNATIRDLKETYG